MNMDPQTRHRVIGIVAVCLFAALFTRLWFLQVLTADQYEAALDDYRTRTVILEAPRGRILDRWGTPLVDNRRSIQVQVDVQKFEKLKSAEKNLLLNDLAKALNDDAELRQKGTRFADDTGPRSDLIVKEPEPSVGAGPAPLDEGEVAGKSDVSSGQGTAEDGTSSADEETGSGEKVPTVATEGHPTSAGVATGEKNPGGQDPAKAGASPPLTPKALMKRIYDKRYSPLKPIPIETGISEELEHYLTEHPERFPAVVVDRVTVRHYSYGALAAHVLGYVGSINSDELKEFQNRTKPYENDDDIGKAGIERGMESELRGVPGHVEYSVDARGRVQRQISRREPSPGRDVWLTLDIDLQYVVESSLAAEISRAQGRTSAGCEISKCNPKAGSAVALDPRNGAVLAMASYPTYDPNIFVGGISTEDFEAINSEGRKILHNFPLLNRAIAGQYAPGSTFKLFSAYAGLKNGIVTPDEYFTDTTGKYAFSSTCNLKVRESNCFAQNAGSKPSGTVDMAEAITISSDTYFYRIGDKSWRARASIGEDGMQKAMNGFGLGMRSGIDLPGEHVGRLPTPDWLWKFSHELNKNNKALADEAGQWRAGTSGNTMVGQGDVVATPLQIANGYAALANGGTVYKPQLVVRTTEFESGLNRRDQGAESISQVDFKPSWLSSLRQGFEGVTKSGTAQAAFSDLDQSDFNIAGKTGTAQRDDENDSALFVGYAPADAPTISLAIQVEFGGFGGETAAPVARRVLGPLSEYGGDITAMHEAGLYRAPKGGYFDIAQVINAYSPTVATGVD